MKMYERPPAWTLKYERSRQHLRGACCFFATVYVSCWKDVDRRKRSCAFAAGDGLNRCHETHCRKRTTALADLSLAHRTVINCTSKTDEDRDVTFSSRAHASCCDWASPRPAHAPPPPCLRSLTCRRPFTTPRPGALLLIPDRPVVSATN
jgi:hypothetical protein